MAGESQIKNRLKPPGLFPFLFPLSFSSFFSCALRYARGGERELDSAYCAKESTVFFFFFSSPCPREQAVAIVVERLDQKALAFSRYYLTLFFLPPLFFPSIPSRAVLDSIAEDEERVARRSVVRSREARPSCPSFLFFFFFFPRESIARVGITSGDRALLSFADRDASELFSFPLFFLLSRGARRRGRDG